MLKKLLLGSAILASLFAGSAQASYSGTYTESNFAGLNSDVTTNFSGGIYDALLTAFASFTNKNPPSNAVAYQVPTSDTITGAGTLGSLFTALYGVTSGIPLVLTFKETAFGGGLASFQLLSFTYGLPNNPYGSPLLTADVTANRTIAGNYYVPGPIAGAGIPLLAALAGFALWRRRAESTAS